MVRPQKHGGCGQMSHFDPFGVAGAAGANLVEKLEVCLQNVEGALEPVAPILKAMKVFNDIILWFNGRLEHLIGYAAAADVNRGLLWIGLADQSSVEKKSEAADFNEVDTFCVQR